MVELNKEYTYPQICEALGWTTAAGNSKIAQIKEIETSFDFYHPVNNKTGKPKKSYIFTGKRKEPIPPSRKNSGGANNKDNVAALTNYMSHFLPQRCLGSWQSYGTWFCYYLCLFDFETYNAPYAYNKEVKEFCLENAIGRPSVLVKYINYARSAAKEIFDKTLEYMRQNGYCEYQKGYTFIADGKKCSTAALNGIIEETETQVCNDLNAEWHLGNFKGRQNKYRIYQKPEWKQEFEGRVIDSLSANKEAADILRRESDFDISIDSDHKLTCYFAVVKIDKLRHYPGEAYPYGQQLTDILCRKARKRLFGMHFADCDGYEVHPYNRNDEPDILTVEQLLYRYYDGQTVMQPSYVDYGCCNTRPLKRVEGQGCMIDKTDFVPHIYDAEDYILTEEEEELFAQAV